MKLLLVIAWAWLSYCVVADTLTSKISRIQQELSSPYEPLALTGETYDLFTAAPRNYSLHVVLTALSSEHKCEPCKNFDRELRLVTAAWGRVFVPGKLYIAVLDFKDGPDVFRKLGINSVPHAYHFPATEGPLKKAGKSNDPELFDFNRRGLDADAYAAFIDASSQVKLVIQRPIDYTMYILGGVLLLVIVVFFRIFNKYLALIYENRKTWIMASVATIILFCSGHMWNHIRGPPYAGVKDGKPEIFAPGFSQQYVGETQAVGILYALIAVAFVGLVTKPKAIQGSEVQRIVAYFFLLAFLFLYSILLNIFKIKNGGYPFRLVSVL